MQSKRRMVLRGTRSMPGRSWLFLDIRFSGLKQQQSKWEKVGRKEAWLACKISNVFLLYIVVLLFHLRISSWWIRIVLNNLWSVTHGFGRVMLQFFWGVTNFMLRIEALNLTMFRNWDLGVFIFNGLDFTGCGVRWIKYSHMWHDTSTHSPNPTACFLRKLIIKLRLRH